VRRALRAQGYDTAHVVAVGSTRQPAGFLLVSAGFWNAKEWGAPV